MRTLTTLRKRTAIVAMVAAIGVGATACFPDVTPGAGPADPTKAAIFQAMNQDRAANGVAPLQYSPKLDNLAGTWAWNMSTHVGFVHQNLTNVLYSPDFTNYSTLGENILLGPGNMTAAQMESAWMNSAGHKANILNRNFNIVGIGVFRGPDGRLWVCVDFGGI